MSLIMKNALEALAKLHFEPKSSNFALKVIFARAFPFFLLTLLISGCAGYTLPIQSKNHPANTDSPVVDIELPPLSTTDQVAPLSELKDYEACFR